MENSICDKTKNKYHRMTYDKWICKMHNVCFFLSTQLENSRGTKKTSTLKAMGASAFRMLLRNIFWMAFSGMEPEAENRHSTYS